MSGRERIELFHRERVERTLLRMAHQIREDQRDAGPMRIYGIDDRGFATAQALAAALRTIGVDPGPARRLAVRDESAPPPEAPGPDEYVIVADDVLFSGTTMVRAIKRLLMVQVPAILRVAVLVDRGHRRFPVQPDFTGIKSPTKFAEHVDVQFDADWVPESVYLLR